VGEGVYRGTAEDPRKEGRRRGVEEVAQKPLRGGPPASETGYGEGTLKKEENVREASTPL